MYFNEESFQFLRPSAKLYELTLLMELERKEKISLLNNGSDEKIYSQIALASLYEKKLLHRQAGKDGEEYFLTSKGKDHIKWATVDFVLEINKLAHLAKGTFRKRLRELYESGSRQVVFYAASDSAHAMVDVIAETGLSLVGVFDDDRLKWGQMVGDTEVKSPDTLGNYHFDTLLITTLVFQEQILTRLQQRKDNNFRIEKLFI